jgi:hypothetical protein
LPIVTQHNVICSPQNNKAALLIEYPRILSAGGMAAFAGDLFLVGIFLAGLYTEQTKDK